MSPAEHLLVDGYNLIKTSPFFRHYEAISLQRARQALVQALGAYARQHGARVTAAGAFEQEMAQPPLRPKPTRDAAAPEREAPLNEAQIAEWERIFQRERCIFDDPEDRDKK